VHREPVRPSGFEADDHVGGVQVAELCGELREPGASRGKAEPPHDHVRLVEQRGVMPLLADVDAEIQHAATLHPA
jgi:hypothetical protein